MRLGLTASLTAQLVSALVGWGNIVLDLLTHFIVALLTRCCPALPFPALYLPCTCAALYLRCPVPPRKPSAAYASTPEYLHRL